VPRITQHNTIISHSHTPHRPHTPHTQTDQHTHHTPHTLYTISHTITHHTHTLFYTVCCDKTHNHIPQLKGTRSSVLRSIHSTYVPIAGVTTFDGCAFAYPTIYLLPTLAYTNIYPTSHQLYTFVINILVIYHRYTTLSPTHSPILHWPPIACNSKRTQ
jgi:hypothetical protein